MRVWQSEPTGAPLRSSEGELVSVSVSVEPRHLEKLLEALGHVQFPINPQIFHGTQSGSPAVVEFPAYSGGLPEVRNVLAAFGFQDGCLRVSSMLKEIQKP
jgi:hypothetical protein